MNAGLFPRPRVSIGMPLYNAERYLDQAFTSLLAQDYPDFEIVVCDNASTDRTWEICQRYAAMDPRIRLYRNEVNRGAAYNYNRVVELARGELFRWAAYDDWCAPELISQCVAALDAGGPAVVLAYPQTQLIDEHGTVVGRYPDRMHLPHARPWRRVAQVANRFTLCNPVFGVIRTDVLRRTGLIRPWPSSDVTLLVELAALGRFHEVPAPLFHRRIHPKSSRQMQGSDRKALAGVAAWFDPRSRGRVRAPKLQLTLRTMRALLARRNGLGPLSRLACALAFAGTFAVRRVRVFAGRVKRRLRGVPLDTPMWAQPQEGGAGARR